MHVCELGSMPPVIKFYNEKMAKCKEILWCTSASEASGKSFKVYLRERAEKFVRCTSASEASGNIFAPILLKMCK